jgi:hypothetical protein
MGGNREVKMRSALVSDYGWGWDREGQRTMLLEKATGGL